MAKLRIAYVLKMYPRFSETFILNEVLELERQGVDLHIFSLRKPDDGRFHADLSRVRAAVTYAPESTLFSRAAFTQSHREVFRWDRIRYVRVLSGVLRKHRASALKHFLKAGYIAPWIRREGITHTHAHFATSATSVALYLRQLLGTSYSFTAHAKDIYINGVVTGNLARKLSSARFAVTVSDYNRRYLSALPGADRLVRIYNGLDLGQFSPNGTVRADPPLVLAVGRLIEKKGFGDLIRACAVLRGEGHTFRCRIVGKGPLESELRHQVRDLRLEGWVELAGPMSRDALLELYPLAAVVAAPCVVGSDGNRDGLPTVLIEAMALGVPVVSTDVTGIPELVEHDRTGIIVPQHAPEELAGAIGQLLADSTRARRLAQAGREKVEQEFDLGTNVAQLRGLFEASATS
jgi:colanic acid/amylovoran biosynthesis glycosyltransferase